MVENTIYKITNNGNDTVLEFTKKLIIATH